MARVLLVDDEEAIRFALADYLAGRGYAVDTAADRPAAEALLARQQYRCALVDLSLAGGQDRDGMQLLRTLRDHHPATVAVLITAHGSEAVAREARQLGALAVLQKPLPLARIVDLLATLSDTAGGGDV